MKTKFKNFTQIALMLFVFFISYSCKKDNNATTNPLINVTVTDFDGNVYNTITIGTQTWMAENLKVKHYRNGEAITNVKDNTDWGNLSTGAYCDVNDTSSYCATYGLLYNWYTVVDSRNLCPTGWHIPYRMCLSWSPRDTCHTDCVMRATTPTHCHRLVPA